MSDLWGAEGSAGGGLPDDFDFAITSSTFGKDVRYGDHLVLILNGTTSLDQADWDVDKVNVKDYTYLVSLGKDWESVDGGKTVQRIDGADPYTKFFNKNSLYYKIIQRCREEFGIEDVLKSRGTPLEAKVWEGLTFHMKREVQPSFNGSQDQQPKDRLMPVAFVGEGAAVSSPAASATPASPSGPVDAAAELTKIAKIVKAKKGSYSDFQDRALEVDGVTDDEALLARVLDEGAGGIWAQA